ncbi:MAG: Na+/H+ antiporter NhaA [Actinomycetota bacterium]|nr:Na+/H+ antiporter NhaA [Actinomycetota bacterium]
MATTTEPDQLANHADGHPVRHTWSESERFVPRAMVRPLQRLLRHEAAGGVVMLVAAVVALAWANSPWHESYVSFWSTALRVELGDLIHLDHLSLQAWVNDALMTLFFLLVGVEIKRELVHGDLRDPRTVALPVIAALGGMAVPAALYALVNSGGSGVDGWGIPMATDIAFAVGVVSLLGRRVPLAAKVFLLTLAVTDDIGAILVIAVFYTGSISWGWLASAAVGLGVIVVLRRNDVQSLAPYLAVGAFAWLALLESGVHATLIGVALGLLTPAWPLWSPRRYPAELRRMADQIDRTYEDSVLTDEEFVENEHLIAEVSRLSIHSTSPLSRLEHALSPWVAFVVVPIFALANAGVRLTGDSVGGLVDDPVTLGVILGLLVGKTVGVFGASFLAVRVGVGRLPQDTTWAHVFGLAVCAGIGFTVALFVASLSFTDPALTDSAKVGILAGSLVAGVAGYLLLRARPLPDASPVD